MFVLLCRIKIITRCIHWKTCNNYFCQSLLRSRHLPVFWPLYDCVLYVSWNR